MIQQLPCRIHASGVPSLASWWCLGTRAAFRAEFCFRRKLHAVSPRYIASFLTQVPKSNASPLFLRLGRVTAERVLFPGKPFRPADLTGRQMEDVFQRSQRLDVGAAWRDRPRLKRCVLSLCLLHTPQAPHHKVKDCGAASAGANRRPRRDDWNNDQKALLVGFSHPQLVALVRKVTHAPNIEGRSYLTGQGCVSLSTAPIGR